MENLDKENLVEKIKDLECERNWFKDWRSEKSSKNVRK